MTALWTRLQTIFAEDRGASLAEYGLVAVLISVVSIVALTAIGENTANNINSVNPGFGP